MSLLAPHAPVARQVDVEIPRSLSEKERELVSELRKERDARANDGKGGFFSSIGL